MRERRSLTAGLGVLAVAVTLAGCGGDTQSATEKGSSAPMSPSSPSAVAAAPSPPPPVSDADQIRAALMAYQDAYNTENWAAYNELMCQKMREQFNGPAMNVLKRTRGDNGLTQIISATDVVVDGTNATAKIDVQNEALGRQTVQFKLARDQDGWKVCMPA